MNGKTFIKDFVIGGALVAFALWLASSLGPVAGGIFAALPIRLAATIALGSSGKGPEFVEDMAKGALVGFVANFLFILVLILTMRSFGFVYSFASAVFVCLVAIFIMLLSDKKLIERCRVC